jgi:DNA-binding NtrC family response regulator
MTSNFTVFIVEDDPFYRKLLEYHLTLNPEISVRSFENGQDCLDNMHLQPDAVTLDYSLPDMSGEEVLKKILNYNNQIPVIIVSGQDNINIALNLLKKGAYDYVIKDSDAKERIWNITSNLVDKIRLQRHIYELEEKVKDHYQLKTKIITNSKAMENVLKMMFKSLKSNITVSITGETGTGKEVVAKSIHYNSNRARKPFVPVNISAIPSELIESELFGHEKGAYTGASSKRIGKFEEAKDGTIFLDEIGEIDINMQAKLLRVLQEKELTRLGGNEIIRLNCRVITATHKNLRDEVNKGKFREDLYFRLIGLPIEIPPLRERDNDVIILAKQFVQEFAKENKVDIKLSIEAQNKLLSYNWPGNIRELKSVVELACVMTDDSMILEDHIIFNSTGQLDYLLQNDLTLEEYKKLIIEHFMEKYKNNVVVVANKLQIGKSTIYRMINNNQLSI